MQRDFQRTTNRNTNSSTNTMITLGKTYTDRITKFKGTAITYTDFCSRPPRVGLAPKVDSKNTLPRDEYFSESRLTSPGGIHGLDHPLARHNVEWEKEYTDKITGFKGRAIARTVHVTGCAHVILQAPVDKNGKIPDVQSFDESRLGIAPAAKREIPGGPMPQPRNDFR